MRRCVMLVSLTGLFLALAAPARACGGLVAPNGSVNLVKTTTLAGYVDGVEHYVTSFEFAGGEGRFGSIVPLPGVPSKVEKGGRWTLQRLVQEVQPVVERAAFLSAAAGTAADSAQVLYETRISGLDITILKGGASEVGVWAKDNEFQLPPDAPEVLDFYARRSPIFLAARFDAGAAQERGLVKGDGVPIHVTIPTPNPWVPLRILALGAQPEQQIEADVFLLTQGIPTMLPTPVRGGDVGVLLDRDERASDDLLADLRSDRGMGWIPKSGMWLSYLRIDTAAKDLRHDLAIDATGAGNPSPIAAGLRLPLAPDVGDETAGWVWPAAALFAVVFLYLVGRVMTPQREAL